MFVVAWDLLDLGLRIHLHVINKCEDGLMLRVYPVIFKSEACYAAKFTKTVTELSGNLNKFLYDVLFTINENKCTILYLRK